jgi:hypothetical protein
MSARLSKLCDCPRHAANSYVATGRLASPEVGRRSKIIANRLGSLNGNGRSKTVFTTLKIAVFAPMPSASVSIAIAVKPGFFANIRAP